MEPNKHYCFNNMFLWKL